MLDIDIHIHFSSYRWVWRFLTCLRIHVSSRRWFSLNLKILISDSGKHLGSSFIWIWKAFISNWISWPFSDMTWSMVICISLFGWTCDFSLDNSTTGDWSVYFLLSSFLTLKHVFDPLLLANYSLVLKNFAALSSSNSYWATWLLHFVRCNRPCGNRAHPDTRPWYFNIRLHIKLATHELHWVKIWWGVFCHYAMWTHPVLMCHVRLSVSVSDTIDIGPVTATSGVGPYEINGVIALG
jgi:hypothetical protein